MDLLYRVRLFFETFAVALTAYVEDSHDDLWIDIPGEGAFPLEGASIICTPYLGDPEEAHSKLVTFPQGLSKGADHE